VNDNPFEVLKLDPSATEEEIVRRAGKLRQTASEEELTAVRQAVQTLTGRAEDRRLLGLLTHPGAVHECPELDRLEAAFRRQPAGTSREVAVLPPLDLSEIATLLRPILIKELDDAPLQLEPPVIAEPPEEILRQTVEGVWAMLPFEPLG
jgi:hypothetical protein